MLHLIGIIIILLSITFNSGPLYADQPGARDIPETTDIHYTGCKRKPSGSAARGFYKKDEKNGKAVRHSAAP